jgi:hypothetical protein
VHEARLGADLLRDPVEEGDDVVLGHALDRVDRGRCPRPRRGPSPRSSRRRSWG